MIAIVRLTLVTSVRNRSLNVWNNTPSVVLRMGRILPHSYGHPPLLLWNSRDNRGSHHNHRHLEDLWVAFAVGDGSSDGYYSVSMQSACHLRCSLYFHSMIMDTQMCFSFLDYRWNKYVFLYIYVFLRCIWCSRDEKLKQRSFSRSPSVRVSFSFSAFSSITVHRLGGIVREKERRKNERTNKERWNEKESGVYLYYL